MQPQVGVTLNRPSNKNVIFIQS